MNGNSMLENKVHPDNPYLTEKGTINQEVVINGPNPFVNVMYSQYAAKNIDLFREKKKEKAKFEEKRVKLRKNIELLANEKSELTNQIRELQEKLTKVENEPESIKTDSEERQKQLQDEFNRQLEIKQQLKSQNKSLKHSQLVFEKKVDNLEKDIEGLSRKYKNLLSKENNKIVISLKDIPKQQNLENANKFLKKKHKLGKNNERQEQISTANKSLSNTQLMKYSHLHLDINKKNSQEKSLPLKEEENHTK